MGNIEKIAVIGAGVMGYGIALVAAQFGKFEVIICDINQSLVEKGIISISEWLSKSLIKKAITEKELKEITNRIHGTTNLKEAASECDFIIEAVTENKEIKKNLLQEASKTAASNTIIVSNTSSIRISELASNICYPKNFCGMHFFNPPQTMKLVEIIKGKQTTDSTVAKVIEVAHKMGKETVVLKRDCPGFIVNRILLPALNEAAELLNSDVAEKEDIDKAIRLGLGWPMGPLALIDQIGIDTVLSISEILSNELGSKFNPSQLLKNMKNQRKLGRKCGRGFYDWK